MNNQPSAFFTVEGIDKTGKTNILRETEKHLSDQEDNVYFTSDPPGVEPWKKLKSQWIESKDSPWADITKALIFLAGRTQETLEQIQPQLEQGKVVIADRYYDSWLAYQSVKLAPHFDSPSDALNLLGEVNAFFLDQGWALRPSRTLYIKEDPARAIERLNKQGDTATAYEDIRTQRAVASVFELLIKREPGRFKILETKEIELEPIIQEGGRILAEWIRESLGTA